MSGDRVLRKKQKQRNHNTKQKRQKHKTKQRKRNKTKHKTQEHETKTNAYQKQNKNVKLHAYRVVCYGQKKKIEKNEEKKEGNFACMSRRILWKKEKQM